MNEESEWCEALAFGILKRQSKKNGASCQAYRFFLDKECMQLCNDIHIRI